MEIKKIVFRKEMKLVTLLLTSLLIATASASVYSWLSMQATPIAAEAATVQFVDGADGGLAGATIGTGATSVTIDSMSGWPGATRVYEDVVGINDVADSTGHTIRLELVPGGFTGATSDIESLLVRVYDVNTPMGTVDVKLGTSTGDMSILDETWRVQWEIKWSDTAEVGVDTVSVTLQLVVTGE